MRTDARTVTGAVWDRFVATHAQAHVLQTNGWGRLKSEFGWSSQIVTVCDAQGAIEAGALVLFRTVAGLTLAYVPKGPLTDWRDAGLTQRLLAEIRRAARARNAVLLKIEPDLPDTAENRARLARYGFRPSPQTVQPRSTIVVDLAADEEAILARMKSKWRYNVRLAGRKGVVVREGNRDDLRHFQDLMETTGERDDFDVHSMDYYRTAFDLFVPEQGAFLFAEYEDEPLAAIVVLAVGKRAWYLWGASSNRHRNRMPNHALQWAAIQWARERGAARYDLWGIPDEIGQVALGMGAASGAPVPAEAIPVDVSRFPDGDLWGVFRFKQGFGGSVERTVGAWDLVLDRAGYALYRAGLTIREMRAEHRLVDIRDWISGFGSREMKEKRRGSSNPQSPISNLQSPISNPQYQLSAVDDPRQWHSILSSLPHPHVLQSWEWGAIKAQTGWTAQRYVLKEGTGAPKAAFQFLWRQPVRYLPLRVAYVPKGPVLDWSDEALVADVLTQIEATCRRHGCLFVKIDPDVAEGTQAGRRLLALLRQRGWRFSPEQIQFKNTGYTDLSPDEDDLLMAMKSKWRYNVRLAGRRGIDVRQGDEGDLRTFYHLYSETGARDGFLVRPFAYYETIWRTFLDAQQRSDTPAGGALFLAEHEDDESPVAGIFLFRYGERAWYFYGASSERRRRDMPNHLLQWRAMQWAKEQGCTVYDWWGAPTDLDDPDDPMQGVWTFKAGFDVAFRAHVGAWDWSPAPRLWHGYHKLMPHVLDWMRRRHGG